MIQHFALTGALYIDKTGAETLINKCAGVFINLKNKVLSYNYLVFQIGFAILVLKL